MEEGILAYLEEYGQPQSVAAIRENVDPEGLQGDVEAVLAGMAALGQIQEINAGIHSSGDPTVEYAPLSFDAAV